MLSLHHTHLMASDIDETIRFWSDGFGGEVVFDREFAGARNVFMTVGSGRLHLYDQPPKSLDQSVVHHVGIQTDGIEDVVSRLRELGVSVTDIRSEPDASYAMAKGPDGLLVEIFQPDPEAVPDELRTYFDFS
ncbi:MAG TPA: VOC family protein [Solirubrobacterales bacterium]|nr:VOC family protein [Solirubrobacterales bacterium]